MIGTQKWRRRTTGRSAAGQERFRWQFELILEGARRAERPFSITQFTCRSVEQAEQLRQLCDESTRVCDAVGIERTNVLVIWDDTAIASASRAARRLLNRFSFTESTKCGVSTVSFPNAGYTPAALIRALVQAPSDPPTGDEPERQSARDTTSITRHPMDRLAG
ncbi:MAG TPA: hypothetical protein VMM60_06810 [Ilumatobacter sp.]|nr:hypothetical protein [Ilumatobacter sp.]